MSEPIVVLDRTTSATGSLVETYIPVEDYENLDVLDSFLSDMYDNQDFKVTVSSRRRTSLYSFTTRKKLTSLQVPVLIG